MTIKRKVNGKNISEEKLRKLGLTNPTLESILGGVRARGQKTEDGGQSGK